MKFNEKVYPTTKPFIIFDLDGTLCNIDHRIHFIRNDENRPDWNSFNKGCINDTLYKHIYMIYACMCDPMFHDDTFGCIIVTGRSDEYADQTIKWLTDHFIHPDYLYMRPKNNYDSDHVFKKSVIDQYLCDARVLFVIEDRDRVVDMWRSSGYKCLQCKKGDY